MTSREVKACIALAALIWVIYLPVFNHGFVNYDDDLYVYSNTRVQAGLSIPNVKWAFASVEYFYHPVTWLSLMLDSQVFGPRPAPMHATNVWLHIVNACLILRLMIAATGDFYRSSVVAALFAVHPLNVETVAWISERKGLLAATFGLISLLGYVGFVKSRRFTYYLISLLSFIVALMSKASVVMLPFVMLLLDLWPFRRIGAWASTEQISGLDKPEEGMEESSLGDIITEKLPFLVLTLISVRLTFIAEGNAHALRSSDAFPAVMCAETSIANYVRFVAKVFWPDRLAVFYPHYGWPGSSTAVVAPFLIGMLIALAIPLKRRGPILFGWLWFLVILFPASGIVQVGMHLTADRYAYLPEVGLFIAVVWGTSELSPFKAWCGGRFARLNWMCVTVALMIVSSAQLRHWENSVTLFEHDIESVGGNPVAELNIASAFIHHNQIAAALPHLGQALRLDPEHDAALMELFLVCGGPENVDSVFGRSPGSLALLPPKSVLYRNMAFALVVNGNGNPYVLRDAIKYANFACKESAEQDPWCLEALAVALAADGQYREAVGITDRAVAAAARIGRPRVGAEIRYAINGYFRP